jgi:type IV secretory pathway VirJ component
MSPMKPTVIEMLPVAAAAGRPVTARLRRCCVWPMAAAVLLGAPAPAAAAPATATATTSATAVPSPQRLSHGRFQNIVVYAPQGTPTSFVLLMSGDEGWSATADTMARQLTQQGAIVAGIDWAKFKAILEADGDECVFPDGDLENLSHFVQAYLHAPSYLSPILVGYSSGASFAYAMLAQAPRNTFAAALTLGFCPALDLQKPLCKGSGLEVIRNAQGRGLNLLPAKSLDNPWLNLSGDADRACPATAAQSFIAQVRGAALLTLPKVGHDLTAPARWLPPFTAGYNKLAAQNPTRVAPPPAGLSDLPVIEIPAQPGVGPSAAARLDSFAIIMSGDGGWAGLDQDVAAALSAKGIPVVGLDSLRYYWTARTPEGLAVDTDRMIRYYLGHFGKKRVLLIGYSQGADVLPFAVNRLPEATRARVALTAVMGMSEHALFEFHLSGWISDDNSGPATLPEINRITGMPVLCIYGADEDDSLCPKLDPKKFDIVKLKGGHHFDGDYAGLAREILSVANP